LRKLEVSSTVDPSIFWGRRGERQKAEGRRQKDEIKRQKDEIKRQKDEIRKSRCVEGGVSFCIFDKSDEDGDQFLSFLGDRL